MGRRRWTEAETNYLLVHSFDDCVKTLDRTPQAIYKHRWVYKITRHAWRKEEIDYLSENYRKIKNKDIAGHLGRSADAVRTKARDLGLMRHGWTAEEDRLVENLCCEGKTAEEIAAIIGRTPNAVAMRVGEFGENVF